VFTRTNPPIIGLVGKKRSGKDTFASVLVEDFGYRRIAFADPLKAMAERVDPIVGPARFAGTSSTYHYLSEVLARLGWEAAKDLVPGVRRTLQNLGQAVRADDPTYWVDKARTEILRSVTTGIDNYNGTPVVVTDVRMENEAQMIRDLGGLVFRITRPEVGSTAEEDRHISETELDGITADETISNSGTLRELRSQAAIYGYRLAPTLF
jgi:hypothetical protein